MTTNLPSLESLTEDNTTRSIDAQLRSGRIARENERAQKRVTAASSTFNPSFDPVDEDGATSPDDGHSSHAASNWLSLPGADRARSGHKERGYHLSHGNLSKLLAAGSDNLSKLRQVRVDVSMPSVLKGLRGDQQPPKRKMRPVIDSSKVQRHGWQGPPLPNANPTFHCRCTAPHPCSLSSPKTAATTWSWPS